MDTDLEKKALELFPDNTPIDLAKREAYILGAKSKSEERVSVKNPNIAEYDILTEDEFKNLFELDPKCTVSEESLKNLSSIIVGGYLLPDDFFARKTAQSIIKFRDKDVEFNSCVRQGRKGWRELFNGLGDTVHVEATFKYVGTERNIPFWTCKTWEDPELKSLMGLAFSTMESVLKSINTRYTLDYGVSFRFELDKWSSNEWFWRVRNTKVHKPVGYINDEGRFTLISEYGITCMIANRENVWVGRLQPEISRIINSIKQ